MKSFTLLSLLLPIALATPTPSFFERAVGDTCSASEGRGSCQSTSVCKGISYPQDLCPNDPDDIQCCVTIACNVPGAGSGYCRSASNNGCAGGSFHPGTSAPWPCPGDSDIQCCIAGPTNSGGDGSGPLPGLSARQSDHARVIASTAKSMNLPQSACVIAISVALVESSITIYANSNVPASLNIPHEAVGSDHFSVGIFQQQTPMWGTVEQCMGVASSATLFYNALQRVSGWQSLDPGVAAQKVQKSAYPDRYQQRVGEGKSVCGAAW